MNHRTPLSRAILRGHVPNDLQPQPLFSSGSILEPDNIDSISPIIHACLIGNAQIIMQLLEQGLKLPKDLVLVKENLQKTSQHLTQLSVPREPDPRLLETEKTRIAYLKPENALPLGSPVDKVVLQRQSYLEELAQMVGRLQNLLRRREKFVATMQRVMTDATDVVDKAIAEDSILLHRRASEGESPISIQDTPDRLIVKKFLSESDDVEDEWRRIRHDTVKLLGPVLGDDLVIISIEKLRDKVMKQAWQKIREVRAQEEELLGGVHHGMGQLALVVDHVVKWTQSQQDRWKSELESWLNLLRRGAAEQRDLILTLVADVFAFVRDLRMDFRRIQSQGAPADQISRQLSTALESLQQLQEPLQQLVRLSKTRLGDLGGDMEMLHESFGGQEQLEEEADMAFLDNALMVTEDDLEYAMRQAEDLIKTQRLSIAPSTRSGKSLGDSNSLRMSAVTPPPPMAPRMDIPVPTTPAPPIPNKAKSNRSISPPPPTDAAPLPTLEDLDAAIYRKDASPKQDKPKLTVEVKKKDGKIGALLSLWEQHPEFEGQQVVSPAMKSPATKSPVSSLPSPITSPLTSPITPTIQLPGTETKKPGKLGSMVNLWESQPGVGTPLLPGQVPAAHVDKLKTPVSSKPLK